MPTLLVCLVWASIFATKSVVGGFTFSQIINYYLLVNLFTNVIGSHFEEWRVHEIRQGKIDYYMIRPFSYLWELWWDHAGKKVLYISFALVLFFLLRTVMFTTWQLEPLTLTPMIMGQVLVCLAAGFLLDFFIALFIVMLGFWFEQSQGLDNFKWIIQTIFSGALLPFALMPDWLQSIVNVLPFKYMMAWPIDIIQGKQALIAADYLYLLCCLGGMYAGLMLLWRYSIKNYASSG